MNGQVLSHYEVLERVGIGGMGEVFRARDTRLERDVALKFLSPDRVPDPTARERLVREARAASALDHPNVCTVYEIDESADGELFIAMAYCRGLTLEERLGSGDLPLEATLEIARQVAEGLGAAHALGITHRDVKPGNVMVTDEGRVKIVDFGLARQADARLTREGDTAGTTAYMAPEQLRGEDVDARADVWAFGVLLYQMLTRRLPFQADYEQAVMYRILHDEADPMDVDLPDDHAHLAVVVEDCLHKDPAERPSMRDIVQRLREQAAPPPVAKGRTLGRSLFENRRLTKTVTGLGAALALAFALLLAMPPSMPSEKYVVVLPLSAVGDSQEDQLLSDGLTVTLTNQLAQLAGFTDDAFWVVPHSEVRGREITSPSMAQRALGATLVLEGNIVRLSSGLRMTFSLIDTRTLRTVGATELTIRPDQSERLQEEVASHVARMMRLQLADASEAALRAGRTTDSEAFDPYIRAQAFLDRYERKENLLTAVDLLEEAVALDSGFGAAYAALGEAHWRLYGETRDELHVTLAQRNLETALEIDERLAAAHVATARVYAGTGRYEQAIAAANRAITYEPANADAYTALGRIQTRMGLGDEAETSFQRAVTLRPAYWGGHVELGTFYYMTARYEEAVDQFREVVRLTPDNAQGYSHLGAAYFLLDRPDEAAAAFERSLDIHPTAEGFSNLATLYHSMDRLEDAAEAYRRALAIEDGNYRIWSYLSQTFAELGHEQESAMALQEAIRRAERRLQVNPNDERVLAGLAGLLIDSEQHERAREILDSFGERHIADIEVMAVLGEEYARLGDHAAALDWWCEALLAGYPRSHITEAPALSANSAVDRLDGCKPS